MPYRHLTASERTTLMHLKQLGWSHRKIGQHMGRSHTTIGREVKRNARRFGRYRADVADRYAQARRHAARHSKRQSNDRLVKYILKQLRRHWSPEVIAN